MKANIVVLVSGGGTNLAALLEAEKEGRIKSGRIVAVISDREHVRALERAREAGIPALAFNKKTLGQQAFEDHVQQVLLQHKADLIIMAGFLSILTQDFTDRWPQAIINVHPSLIPAFSGEGYYGLKVHEAALQRGVKLTGATVHYVDAVPDGGPIILQKAVKVKKKDTPETLQQRVMQEAEWLLLPKAAEKICRKIVKRKEKTHVSQ